MDYGFNHEGRVYFPNTGGTQETPEQTAARNAEMSKAEVEAFKGDPPERLFCYVKEYSETWAGSAIATTWVGDYFGRLACGRPWKDNLGGTRVPVTLYGVNGKTYHGTYYKSSGDYARMRLAKKQ